MAPLSILQITDLHILPDLDETFLGINTAHYFHAILELAFEKHHHFDFILLTGDLAQHPCPASYQRILTALKPLTHHAFACPVIMMIMNSCSRFLIPIRLAAANSF